MKAFIFTNCGELEEVGAEDFLTIAKDKNRYFTKFDDYMLEVTKKKYEQFKREDNHLNYLKKDREKYHTYSLDQEFENFQDTYAEFLVDKETNIENEVMEKLSFAMLYEALTKLTEEELFIIQSSFMSEVILTEEKIGEILGINQRTVNYRKKNILKKLKVFLVI